MNQIQKAKKIVGHRQTEEQEIREIAEMLNLDASHIRDMLNISKEFISLDAPLSSSENGKTSVGDFVEENRYGNPDEQVIYSSMKDDIENVLNTLKPNEQKVIRLRYGLDGDKPKSLKEIGDICNLTKERIRQIEKHAIVRLQHPTRMRKLENYVA